MFSHGMSFASKCPHNMYQYLKEENEVQEDQIICSIFYKPPEKWSSLSLTPCHQGLQNQGKKSDWIHSAGRKSLELFCFHWKFFPNIKRN